MRVGRVGAAATRLAAPTLRARSGASWQPHPLRARSGASTHLGATALHRSHKQQLHKASQVVHTGGIAPCARREHNVNVVKRALRGGGGGGV